MDLLAHFGFHKMPFTREIAPEEHLALPFLDETLAAVLQRVQQRMSVGLFGAAGTGKTSLLRLLASHLPEARHQLRYVKVTSLSKRDLCREIAAACGLAPAGTYPALVRKLQDHWEAAGTTDGVRPVLVLDDAHEIRPDVLGVLRILTNFAMDSRLVLSVVLAGQLPLRALLAREELEDIARRLTFYATLRLLSRDEALQYVQHRCAIAGAATLPFDTGALDALYEITLGNLRALDNLALGALEVAARGGLPVASSVHVATARRTLWA